MLGRRIDLVGESLMREGGNDWNIYMYEIVKCKCKMIFKNYEWKICD